MEESKAARTLQSRRKHWIKFLHQHYISIFHWDSLSITDKDMIYACYATSLVAGKSIKSISLKTDTIKRYLEAAGYNSLREQQKSLLFNRWHSTQHNLTPLVHTVLKEHSRWMSVPNRREPITKNMLVFWASKQSTYHPDSLEAALIDWMILGSKTGVRKSEWCQDFSDIKKGCIAKNVDGSSKAFIATDFNLCHRSARQNTSIGIENPEQNVVFITWRFQKNGYNGEKIPFVKDHTYPSLCPVQSASRILNRAYRLHVPTDKPIAVFRNSCGKVEFINQKQVQSFIREAASKVYNITSKEKLKLFSCHSVRVGACVALHVGGADPMSIKARLRWRSNSFEMYLRHVVRLGSIHNTIFNRSNPDDTEPT